MRFFLVVAGKKRYTTFSVYDGRQFLFASPSRRKGRSTSAMPIWANGMLGRSWTPVLCFLRLKNLMSIWATGIFQDEQDDNAIFNGGLEEARCDLTTTTTTRNDTTAAAATTTTTCCPYDVFLCSMFVLYRIDCCVNDTSTKRKTRRRKSSSS